MPSNFEFGYPFQIRGKEYRADHSEEEYREILNDINEINTLIKDCPEDEKRIVSSCKSFINKFFGAGSFDEIFNGLEPDLLRISQLIMYMTEVIGEVNSKQRAKNEIKKNTAKDAEKIKQILDIMNG